MELIGTIVGLSIDRGDDSLVVIVCGRLEVHEVVHTVSIYE